MKNSLYTLLLLLMSLSLATAQTEKGRWTVGADVGNLSYSSQYGYRSFSGSLSPSAGYFAVNNLVAGAGLPVSFGTGSSNSRDYRYQTTVVGLSPFVRYYFGAASLKPYVGVSYAYSRTSQRTNSPNPNQQSTYKGFSSNVSPNVGLAYFINRTVSLNAGLSYVKSWYNNGAPDYNNGGIRVESITTKSDYLSLNVGFQLFFGK